MGDRDEAAPGEVDLTALMRAHRETIVLAASRDADIEPDVLEPAFDEIVRLLGESESGPERFETFRREGERLARTGASGTHVIDGYLSLNWALWEAVMHDESLERDALPDLALRMMKGIDRATSAVVDGFVRYEINSSVARNQHHRAVLDDLLTSRRSTPEERARIRRRAQRYGVDPDDSYRLVFIIVCREAEHADREIGDAMRRLEPHVSPPSPRAPGSAILLPQLVEWRDRSMLVVARSSWLGERRLRAALPGVLGEEWLAVDSGVIDGVDDVREALHDIEHAAGIAADLGRRGWIGDSRHLALETMFLMDDELSHSVVHQELGPLLQDARMGEELIETLGTYLRARQNVHETARRMHLAPRTVSYRIRRAEELLGFKVDGDASARLATAILVLQATREAGRRSREGEGA